MMESTVYILCTLTAALVALLLLRGYRRSHARLLLFACICFAWLTVSNVLLFVDKIVFPAVDLSWWHAAAALFGMASLLVAMVLESGDP